MVGLRAKVLRSVGVDDLPLSKKSVCSILPSLDIYGPGRTFAC